MRNPVSISIIIPTLNRQAVLKEALLSLNGLDYPRHCLEVIVINDGSTDDTVKEIAKLKKHLRYPFRFINEKRQGISHAKNVGIKKAKGEIIVTTDDDCLFEKNWLKKLIKPLNHPQVGSVGGPDRAIKNEGILAKSIDFTFSSFIGSGGIHGRFLKAKLGKVYPPGCNMAFKKDVVARIGYFDETLAPGEDTDFNYRLEKAGFKLAHVPAAFVWHRPRNSVKRFIPYIFKRGKARVEIIRRHPQNNELIYFLPVTTIIVGVALLILSLFSSLFLKILLGLSLAYLLLLTSAGVSAFRIHRHPAYLFIIPTLIFLQHLLHGIGFLKGTSDLIFRKNR